MAHIIRVDFRQRNPDLQIKGISTIPAGDPSTDPEVIATAKRELQIIDAVLVKQIEKYLPAAQKLADKLKGNK